MGIVEVAGELFEKSVELAGTVAKQAGDFASTAGLRAQILDKNVEYDKLMKELGHAVYDIVKNDPEIVEANQSLFARIAGVSAARQELEDKLSAAEAAADAKRPIDVDPVPPEVADAARTVKDAAAQVAEHVKAAAGDAAKQVRDIVDEAADKAGAAAGKPGTDEPEAPAAPQADVRAEAESPRPVGYRSATNAGAQEVSE